MELNRILQSVIFIAITFLAADICFAVTYHVRTDGNDAGCSGLYNAADPGNGTMPRNGAFRTILKGINSAQAGDTVTIHTGSYTEEILISSHAGSEGKLITIRAGTDESVIISRIKINHDFIVVKGFRVTNSGRNADAGISLTGSYCQALNNIIVGNSQPWIDGEGSSIGLWSAGNHNVISYNIWDGNNNSSNSFGIGIYLTKSTSDNEISHNLLKDINSPGRLFEIYGTGHVISYNEVRNSRTTYENTKVHVDIFQGFNSSSYNIIVENNYFHDFDGQFVMFADWQVPGAIHHWTFRNNVWANIGSCAFIKSKNIYFYNNTFYHVGQRGIHAIIYSNDEEGDGSDGQFINNVLIPNATNLSDAVQLTNTKHCNNYYGSTSFGPREWSETGMVNGGDPKFVAAYTNCVTNTCDFHISANSVLLDKGSTLAGFTTDKDGVLRPQGSAWDIGAYEYVSIPSVNSVP
jgi:hypothetical protein